MSWVLLLIADSLVTLSWPLPLRMLALETSRAGVLPRLYTWLAESYAENFRRHASLLFGKLAWSSLPTISIKDLIVQKMTQLGSARKMESWHGMSRWIGWRVAEEYLHDASGGKPATTASAKTTWEGKHLILNATEIMKSGPLLNLWI